MNLEKYLELIFSIYENFYEILDEYYKKANFITDVTGNVPIKFIVENGELKVLIKKHIYSYDGESKVVNIALSLYKPILSNNYMVEGMVVYPLNNSVIGEAIEYVEKYKDVFRNFHERKSFYNGTSRVTIESYDFSKDKDHSSLEITFNYGNYESAHLYVNLDKRYLETVDTFNRNHLKEIIIPEELMPPIIKEISMANNFPITPLTEEELTIHLWHPQPPKNNSERSKRRWLTF